MNMYEFDPFMAEPEIDIAAAIFRLLGDATRVRLVALLLDGEASVSELVDGSGREQSAVSQHLAKLRLGNLVTSRRDGPRIIYRLANDHVRQLLVDGLQHAEHIGSDTPGHHQRVRAVDSGVRRA